MKIEEIPRGQVYIVVTPKVNAMISGAYKAAFYPSGKVVLAYVDGTSETAQFTIPEAQAIADGMDNWFSIVSAVQSKRKQEV